MKMMSCRYQSYEVSKDEISNQLVFIMVDIVVEKNLNMLCI